MHLHKLAWSHLISCIQKYLSLGVWQEPLKTYKPAPYVHVHGHQLPSHKTPKFCHHHHTP
jgi:hypothetical protein